VLTFKTSRSQGRRFSPYDFLQDTITFMPFVTPHEITFLPLETCKKYSKTPRDVGIFYYFMKRDVQKWDDRTSGSGPSRATRQGTEHAAHTVRRQILRQFYSWPARQSLVDKYQLVKENCRQILITATVVASFGFLAQRKSTFCDELDVHGSVHRNINLIERTNKMQPCSRIYYSSVS